MSDFESEGRKFESCRVYQFNFNKSNSLVTEKAGQKTCLFCFVCAWSVLTYKKTKSEFEKSAKRLIVNNDSSLGSTVIICSSLPAINFQAINELSLA